MCVGDLVALVVQEIGSTSQFPKLADVELRASFCSVLMALCVHACPSISVRFSLS